MLISRASIRLSVALALTSVTFFATSSYGQSSATGGSPDNEKEVAAAPGPRSTNPQDKAVAPGPRPTDLENEVAAVKADNAAVREQLRRMEEQQKALLEMVDRLQRRLDGSTVAEAPRAAQPPGPAHATEASAPSTGAAGSSVTSSEAAQASVPSAPAPPVTAKPTDDDRYQDGIIIVKTGEDARIPFFLKLNNNTQFRFLNTLSSPETFTDHLGVVREVHNRNDLTVNRSMFILGGYAFDERLLYSLTVWTSAGAASIVVAGNIGWRFNKALTITGGYTGVPGSRSLVNTFPYFAGTDRSLADNFFRPAFTQGIWANGEPVKGLNYLVFLGNGLNTLSISANKIDTNLLYAGSVWWEPLGDYAPPGKSRNMYDDYFASEKVRIRIGTSYTRSREDRFSNLDVSNPDNTSIHNSDGVLAFSTGAFAPGVTLQEATYRMWAIDGGIKWNGLSVNGQYYFRWLNDFLADGPMPLSSTFDHGGELSAGHFVIPKKLQAYLRGSRVWGQFGDSWEYAGGVKWHMLPTERLWFSAELMRVHNVPYGGAFTPYTPGMNGWVPMIQTVIGF